MNHPSPLEEIFFAALEKGSPEEREAFLSEACAGDSDLRGRLKKMLAAQVQAGSFLEKAAIGADVDSGATLAVAPIAEQQGAVIAGRYKLIEEIGEGGMGTVWMAQQTEPVKRLVAVKLIKAGMDSRQMLARFEAERQALALMDHPNIAKVLDAGTTAEVGSQRSEVGSKRSESNRPPLASDLCPLTSGRPYFVMELVKGQPITRYCDEHRLTLRERLELFIPVCQAVGHAHQKGIIHRDLKPSNVLVALYDGKPVPKVIDFGVAKAAGQQLTDKTLVTGFGAIVGTLEYMSPEQAEVNQLDIDTRSDIYSLGVLLYELLTGSTPFTRQGLEKAGLLEMLRVIREQEPSKPSTKLSERSRHAPRAAAGAGAHVDTAPMNADGTLRVPATLPAIAAMRRSEPAKLSKLMRGELDWIVMKALEKDRNRRYESAGGFANDVHRYLDDEPVQACPPSASYRLGKFARKNKARLATAGVLAAALLVAVSVIGWAVRDRAATQSQRVTRTTTQVDMILANARTLMAEQKWDEALAVAKRAEAALVSGEADDATQSKVEVALEELEFVSELERIRMSRISMLSDDRRNDVGAMRNYERALREFGVDVRSLPTEDAQSALKRHEAIALPLAAALDEWADCIRSTGSGQIEWKAMIDLARRLDVDPLRDKLRSFWGQQVTPALQSELERLVSSVDVAAHSPSTLRLMGATLGRAGLADLELKTLELAQREHPGDFWLNVSLWEMNYRDRHGEAVLFGNVALGIRPTSSLAHCLLGVSASEQKNFQEALAYIHKAIELDPNFAFAYLQLGVSLDRQDRADEALACFRKAIDIDPQMVVAHFNLGTGLLNQGDLIEALACYRKTIDIDPRSYRAHNNVGIVFERQGKLVEASASFRSAIAIDPKQAEPYGNLGRILLAQGNLNDAIASFRQAIELDPGRAIAHYRLGKALERQGKLIEATACFQQSVNIDPNDGFAQGKLGNAYQARGLLDEAAASYRNAIEAYRKAIDSNTNDGMIFNNLAYLLCNCPAPEVRNPSEAIELARRAVTMERPEWYFWGTLSVAYYRNGDWNAALEARQEAIRRENTGEAACNHGLWLAMIYWQLDRKDEARQEYEKIKEDAARRATTDAELRMTLEEAEDLLENNSSESNIEPPAPDVQNAESEAAAPL